MTPQDRDLPRLSAHIEQHGSAAGFVPTPRKKRNREESQMGVALTKWWHMQHRVFGVPEILLFKITNEGLRSPAFGALMKAEGLRRGAPDYMLAVARWKAVDKTVFGSSHIPSYGLFLELKRPQGVLSPEQEVFHEILRSQGYAVKVAWSLVEAINAITGYLHK